LLAPKNSVVYSIRSNYFYDSKDRTEAHIYIPLRCEKPMIKATIRSDAYIGSTVTKDFFSKIMSTQFLESPVHEQGALVVIKDMSFLV